jgi:hypothetical protein
MYQLAGENVIFAWLEREPNQDFRLAFLEWLAALAVNPTRIGSTRLPGIRAPLFVEVVPLGGKHVVVRFLIAEQFRTVRILGIGPLP